jgi:hypothetical protein
VDNREDSLYYVVFPVMPDLPQRNVPVKIIATLSRLRGISLNSLSIFDIYSN